MERSKILTADYLDIVFDKRNKKYGGYELRRHYNERMMKALGFIFLGLGAVISFSFINSKKVITVVPSVTHGPTEWRELPKDRPKIDPPKVVKPVQPPPPVKTTVFNVPRIEPDKEVKPDEQLTENKNLVNNNPGPTNHDGDTTLENPPIVGTGKGKPEFPPTPPAPTKIPTWIPQMPQFSGDMNAYIAAHLHYPEAARQANIEGPVLIKFVVNEDGSVSDATVVRGIGGGCDEEALRMVAAMPKWKAGKNNGVPVKVYFTLPIRFVLADQ